MFKNKVNSVFLLLVLVSLVVSGCMGGSKNDVATVPVIAVDTNIVSSSINMAAAADGSTIVTWQTKAPSKDNHILVAKTFFKDNPLYGEVVSESLAKPSTDHKVILKTLDKNSKHAIAIIDSNKDLEDNGGKGFLVK
jgi:hypothetical protein